MSVQFWNHLDPGMYLKDSYSLNSFDCFCESVLTHLNLWHFCFHVRYWFLSPFVWIQPTITCCGVIKKVKLQVFSRTCAAQAPWSKLPSRCCFLCSLAFMAGWERKENHPMEINENIRLVLLPFSRDRLWLCVAWALKNRCFGFKVKFRAAESRVMGKVRSDFA